VILAYISYIGINKIYLKMNKSIVADVSVKIPFSYEQKGADRINTV